MKQSQSLAGYIRQHLDELEARLEVGIRQDVLVAELEVHGYKTTLKGFRNFLYRARLRAEKTKAQGKPQPMAQTDAQPAMTLATPTTGVSETSLTKSRGFEFVGTSEINESELI